MTRRDSGVNEAIARVLNSSGKELFSTINALIGDPVLAANFWSDSLVTGLTKSRATATAPGVGGVH